MLNACGASVLINYICEIIQVVIIDVLRRAGADVVVASVEDGLQVKDLFASVI